MEDSRPEAPEPVPAQAAPTPPAKPQSPQDSPAEPEPALPQAAPTPPTPQPAPQQPARPYPPHHPAGPVTADQYQRQAGYYQQLTGPPRMLPPNPRWHRPESIPNPAVVVLAVAVALFGAWAAFHSTGVGIGLSLTGIAFLAVPLAMGDRRDLVPRLPGAVLVAALWSVAAIRDAGWVVFLCSAAAFLLTPLALAPQRRFSGTALTLFMGWLEGLAAAFGWAKRGRRGKDGRTGANMRNVWVVLVTALLLIVFGGLFAAADSTFAGLVVRLLPEVSPAEFILRMFLAAVLFPLALLWIYTAVAKPSFDSDRPEGEHRVISRFELAVPLGALNLLFVAFIAVQLRVFLGGEEYVMETAGLTFAEYARKGFWQLSFVSGLALAVIAVAAWLAPKRTKADRWAARILLGALCVLSMVVIASALYRMYTYAETYGLTRMRVWIFTVEIWLAVLFALVIVCCWKLRAAWLPRAVLASGALALLGLAGVNPDAYIARYNLAHEHALDLDYLDDLSDDAVPEFADLTEEQLDCMLDRPWDADEERDLMAWNLGHQRAQELLKEHQNGSAGYCDGDGRVDDYGAPDPGAATEASAFFDTETCSSIDHTTVEGVFDEPGLQPDPNTSGTWLESDATVDTATTIDAWLTCSYEAGPDGYMTVTLQQYDSDIAADHDLNAKVTAYEAEGFTVDVQGSAPEARYISVSDDPDYQAYRYHYTAGNIRLESLIAHGPIDQSAATASVDLTGQLENLYYAFA